MRLTAPNRPALIHAPTSVPALGSGEGGTSPASEISNAAPLVMGVMNLTPDSFSDGGQLSAADVAIERGLAMAKQGASLLDLGAESTRPGAQRVSAAEQWARLLPVVGPLRQALDDQGFAHVWLSVDTTLSAVAEPAIAAGASFINDVSGGLEDPKLFDLAAEAKVPLCLMHMQGQPGTMQQNPTYEDVVAEVHGFLARQWALAEAAGVPRGQIVLDPGIGFGKTLAHNQALFAALPELVAMGQPVLLGASRKRFIAELCPEAGAEATDRLPGTLATSVWAAFSNVQLIRVHDVAANVQAIRVATWAKGPRG